MPALTSWGQVWLAMPGESNRSAGLYWFRVVSDAGHDLFGDVLAADAANYFAGACGFTSNRLENDSYVHAYVSVHRGPLIVRAQGTAPFPGPAVIGPLMPACSGLILHRCTATQRIKNAKLGWSATLKTWVSDGRPNADAFLFAAQFELALQLPWTSQGVVFRHVIPQYLTHHAPDFDHFELAPRLGGYRKRQQKRADRFHGNIPKFPP